MTTVSATIALFLEMDPIGNIPVSDQMFLDGLARFGR